MICEHCHAKPASVHMVQVINGKRSEEYLCQDCAKKEHVFEEEKDFFGSHAFDTPFGSLMDGAMKSFFMHPFSGITALERGPTDFVEVEKPGFLGGQESYGEFKEKLKGAGKKETAETSVENDKAKSAEESELAKLKKELAVCVSREEYERAAEVRDKIRKLENR